MRWPDGSSASGSTLQVAPGERVALLGRSGAGKTTTVEALAGLQRLTRGDIRLGERPLELGLLPNRRRAPGATQSWPAASEPGLFPHLTVLQNIGYARGVDAAAARVTAQRLGLGALLDARPRGLSGRRGPARFPRSAPSKVDLLCLDEPFKSLDRPFSVELLDLLRRELDDSATSAILVTHQLEEAQAFAQRLAILHRGQILQMAHARELVLQPASREVAELVGYRGWLSSGSSDHGPAPRPRCIRSPLRMSWEISARVVGLVSPGSQDAQLELEAEGRWRGRFRCRSDRSATVGELMWFAAPGAPIFPAAEEPRTDLSGG